MNLSHPVIAQILDAATDVLDKRVQDWKVSYIETRNTQLERKAAAKAEVDAAAMYSKEYRLAESKYHKINVWSEMSDRIESDYRLSLQLDLIRAMAGYLLRTDKIASAPSFSFEKGNLVLNMAIERNGIYTHLFTQVILVQGDIKVWHYRYRVETDLPKIDARPYMNWLEKTDSLNAEIARMEKRIADLQAGIEANKTLTYEQYAPTSQYYSWLTRPENADRIEELKGNIMREFKNKKSVAWPNKEIKGYQKQIDKLKSRIAAYAAAAHK